MEVNFKNMQKDLEGHLNWIDSLATEEERIKAKTVDFPVMLEESEEKEEKAEHGFRDVKIEDLDEATKDRVLKQFQRCFGLLRSFTFLIEE